MTSLRQIINTYHDRGFKINHSLGDRQLESIRKHMEPIGIMVNTAGHDEHVPEIERYVRTIKREYRQL